MADELAYQKVRYRRPSIPMQYTTLGRTNLKVSVMGLGTGGNSRLGLSTGHGERHAIRLIHRAMDQGVNLLDTAYTYNNEAIVGTAIQDRDRAQIILSTKRLVNFGDAFITPIKLSRVIDKSLERLQTDYIDIFQMHGVELHQYEYTLQALVPVLQAAQQAGKIRFIGITESFSKDLKHRTLQRALADDIWDVMMVGFNLLNQTARDTIIAPARTKQVGILNMFAVRKALRNVTSLVSTLENLEQTDWLATTDFTNVNTLATWLKSIGHSYGMPEVAYRYCRHEPGIDAVLFGTSSFQHLDHNIESLLKPPLDQDALRRIEQYFGHMESISGN